MERDYTFAIDRKYHQMDAHDMAKDLRGLMDPLPKLRFEELKAGHLAYKRAEYTGDRERVFKVVRVTPKRTQLEAVVPDRESEPFKVYKGSCPGPFIILDQNISSMLGVTHRQVVEEAVKRGLDVPNFVRVEYPDLFVELPERFKPERLIETVRPQWGQKVTALVVAAFIEERHQRIRQIECVMSKAVVLNPALVPDKERYLEGYREDIDFFRWLLPHVSEGGALYL